MRLVVDGEIFTRQAHGGISRLFVETLPRLCDLNPDLDAVIITDGRLRQPVPAHPQIVHRPIPSYETILRPGRLFRPVVTAMKQRAWAAYAGLPAQAVWQATYYTPPERWQGVFSVIFHDLIEERFPEFFDKTQHEVVRRRKDICARQADVAICVSRTTQADVCATYGLPVEKTRLITLAAAPVFRALTPEEMVGNAALPARPFLFYVGERTAYKNFALLLTAYAAWSGRAEVDLAVVGRQWTPDELAALAEMGLTDRIHHYQFVDDEFLCLLYNRAAAFVFPSLYEGFGIPLLEAMACRCPVVASDIPTTREVAGRHPFYFDARDAGDLQRALDAALNGGRQQDRLDGGQQHAATFSWQNTARQLDAIYRDLAN